MDPSHDLAPYGFTERISLQQAARHVNVDPRRSPSTIRRVGGPDVPHAAARSCRSPEPPRCLMLTVFSRKTPRRRAQSAPWLTGRGRGGQEALFRMLGAWWCDGGGVVGVRGKGDGAHTYRVRATGDVLGCTICSIGRKVQRLEEETRRRRNNVWDGLGGSLLACRWLTLSPHFTHAQREAVGAIREPSDQDGCSHASRDWHRPAAPVGWPMSTLALCPFSVSAPSTTPPPLNPPRHALCEATDVARRPTLVTRGPRASRLGDLQPGVHRQRIGAGCTGAC